MSQRPRKLLSTGLISLLLFSSGCGSSTPSSEEDGGGIGPLDSAGGVSAALGGALGSGGNLPSSGGAVPAMGGRLGQGGVWPSSGGASLAGTPVSSGGVAPLVGGNGPGLLGGAAGADPSGGALPVGGMGLAGSPASGGVSPSGGFPAAGSSQGGIVEPASGGKEDGGVSANLGGSAGMEVAGGGTGPGIGGSDEGGAANGGQGQGGGAAIDDATIVPDPSWACGMPDGVVPPSKGTLVFQATLELGETHEVGLTQYGERRLLDVTGGDFEGDQIQGSVLTGGLELELELSNGATELEEINILEASDGTPILMRNCGFAPAGATATRVVPDFEAPNGSSFAWLNEGSFAATRTVDEAAGTIQLDVYDVSDVEPGEPRVVLEDPGDLPDQPWECSTKTGGQGAEVFTESVSLGTSISIGASKRGTRNIIPITGGNVTGRFEGSVLFGGADYQILSGQATLDARYSLVSNDDVPEYVIVRNCGPMGALVPLFETRAEGAYAFLNENDFVSSNPDGDPSGGVRITFHERQ